MTLGINKTLEAWARGYAAFTVNGQRFWRYGAANAYADRLQAAKEETVIFMGFHVFKGWRTFLAVYTPRPVPPPYQMHARL